MQSQERYRNTAPTTTIRPVRSRDAVKKDRTREGGRRSNEFRQIFMKTGIITQASGSAYLEMNKTKVIVGVFGPRQTPKMEFSEKAKLECEFKFATFACRKARRGYQQDKEEKEFSSEIKSALEASIILDKFPKSVIDVYVLVLESSGGALCAAITCSSLALADAGIDMFDLVASCSVSIHSNQLLLDPTDLEEEEEKGNITVGYMPSLNEVTQLLQSGEADYTQAQEAIELCLDGCSKIYAMMRVAIVPQKTDGTNGVQ